MVLSILSYTLLVLSLLYTSLHQVLLLFKALGSSNGVKNGALDQRQDTEKTLSIVIPSKNEPIDIVLDRLNRLSFMECYSEVILVLDDEIAYVNKLVSELNSRFFDKGGVVVSRLNGFGGRNGALSDGCRMALGENVMIMDVDAIPSQSLLCNARTCSDVCVAVWEPYVEVGTRVEEGMAFITRFGSWLFYELRYRAGLFIYPLGSGTAIDREIIRSVGFWRPDVIQDDIWLGYELLSRGIKPRLLNGHLLVSVPRTLNSARIQQCRWSYGSVNIFSRFVGKVLRAPVKTGTKIEAIFYSTQPIASLLALLAFITALPAALLEKNLNICPALLIPIAAAVILQAIVLRFFCSSAYRVSLWKMVYLSGRVSAIYTVLTPLLGYSALKGLARARYKYRITPKSLQLRRSLLDLSEIVALLLSIPTLSISIINKNAVTFIVSLPLALASLYSIVRLDKG
mgnify:CR=1 FL=1